ncbi:MAG: Endonuclease III-like protein 1 [Cirrosporium novae-zelandiae]|nr:MAG: Endonuclease III-like protein 1 [Cirrosporium novae-zelandiae]
MRTSLRSRETNNILSALYSPPSRSRASRIASSVSTVGRRTRARGSKPLGVCGDGGDIIKKEYDCESDSSSLSSISTKDEPLADIEDTLPARPLKRKRSPSPSTHNSNQRRQPAKRTLLSDGTYKYTPPSNWLATYTTMKTQRLRTPAPVDTVGCAHLAHPKASPLDRRFQTLIALMLSSQTKDEVTAAAMRRLQTELPAAEADGEKGLSLENILAVEENELNALIRSVGFHNNKAKYIKKTAVILRDKHGGDVPNNAKELIALPGVGPKMAYLTLGAAWGIVDGIGVDTHVHRITNLWGWHKTKTPEETRMWLEGWLPKEYWAEINELLVGWGQSVCDVSLSGRKAQGRGCEGCEVGKMGLCPGKVKETTTAAKVKKEKKAKIEVEVKNEVHRSEIKKEPET